MLIETTIQLKSIKKLHKKTSVIMSSGIDNAMIKSTDMNIFFVSDILYSFTDLTESAPKNIFSIKAYK